MTAFNIIYEIKAKEFNVPPLSIQPIVENAIKHCITKKIEGGTILIKVHQRDNTYTVEVVDDGVGFDVSKPNFKENNHVGLNNIKTRLKSMCDAKLYIESSPWKRHKRNNYIHK